MKNQNHQPPLDGDWDETTAGERLLPLEDGVLPGDFPERLARLKEATGLTWTALAQALGTDDKQVRRWTRKGVEPSGGAMLSLVRFAMRFPGGLEILLGEGFQLNLWEVDEGEQAED